MISPCSSTRMASAFRTVESRWAITSVVRSAISRSMPSSMCFSVRVSTEEVASSRIRMGALEMAARAMLRSCLWPWLRFAPSPSIMVSYPFSSRMMKEWALAVFAACSTSSSVASSLP